ncbi:HD family phosphohydrolase [Clostridium acetobutylicum]|nr:HD family phosphohydrolase [Clostridium acetobutylicum]
MVTFYDYKSSNLDACSDIDKCLKKLCTLMNFQIIGIITFSDHKKMLYSERMFIQFKNKYKKSKKYIIREISSLKDYAINLFLDKKQVLLYSKDSSYATLIPEANSEIYIPLLGDDEALNGAVYLCSITKTDEKLDLMALEKSRVKNVIDSINRLYKIIYLISEKRRFVFSIINTFSEITREKDFFMLLHPYHVANFSKEIATRMDLSDELIRMTYLSGILHDIGKIYISEAILNKKGPLTEKEFNVIKGHSIYSSNLIKNITELDDIAKIVRHHHESYDGTGYPDNLKGEDIPLISRIIKVADSVDAMLSPRSYKKSKDINYVISELRKYKGIIYDPKVTDSMLDILTGRLKPSQNTHLNAINWSTLTITTNKEIYSIEGSLIKYKIGYLFKTDKFNFIKNIDKSDILASNIYISESTNEIIEYKVKIEYISENEILLSDFKYVVYQDSFNIFWDLKAELQFDTYNTHDVEICKIGGNTLMFYVPINSIKHYEKDKIINLKIFFEDDTIIDISGKILQNFNVGDFSYYDFAYVNILPKNKDEIFRQLFRHQIQLKNLYNK